jgi:hypothetical protein
MKNRMVCLVIAALSVCTVGCDPRYQGVVYVQNDSDQELFFVDTLHSESSDTVFIPANSSIEVEQFEGLGAGRGIVCCPCEIPGRIIHPVDSGYAVTKSALHQVNWDMDNTNEKIQDRYHIKCTFILRNSDLLIVD